jgi:hypothetical protein
MNRAVPQTTDELPARVFWQRWRELMLDPEDVGRS